MSAPGFDRLVRWYPASWRARYGDEMTALMEDTYGEGPVPARDRIGLAGAVVREHLAEVGLRGRGDAPSALRAGAFLVLWGWGAFVLAGSAFAKYAEGYEPALPKSQRLLPVVGFDLVFAAAIVGLVVVGLGAVLALRSFVTFLREGGWPQIRTAVRRTMILGALSAAYLAGIVIWAHSDGPSHLSGSWFPKGTVLIGFVAVVGLTIASCVAAAGSAVRRLELSNRLLRLEGALALVLTVVMATVLTGTILWWGEMAAHAPWFFTGAPSIHGDQAPPVLVFASVFMAGGLLAAASGCARVLRSARAVR